MKRILAILAAASGALPAAEKPNVLFIAVDDLKPLIGCYGDTRIKTPQIDRLASQGTVFLNAHCQQAVCGPSRASLLTGLRPDTTKVWDLKTKMRDITPDILTLPQHFRANGYEAVGLGKIFDPRCVDGGKWCDKPSWSRPYIHVENNPDSEMGLLNKKFVDRARAMKKKLGRKGADWGSLKKALGGMPPFEGSEDVPDEAYGDGMLAKTAVGLVAELSAAGKPFFLAVGFKKPHLPFVAPKKYWDLYRRDEIEVAKFQKMPAGAPGFHFQDSWELKNGSYSLVPRGPGLLPIDMQREMIHGYMACVSYIDTQIGKVLDALEANGVAGNTIVVLWGDHGWHLGDHGMWCKHTNYEQATRAPLIIARRANGGKPAKSSSPVEFVDIFPTLCDLAGLPKPAVLEGTTLLPVLDNPKAHVKEAAVSQYPRRSGRNALMGYAFRDERYRYVEWLPRGEASAKPVASELYDYREDPLETKNLASDPARAEVLGRMQTLARKFHARHNPSPAPPRRNAPRPAKSN